MIISLKKDSSMLKHEAQRCRLKKINAHVDFTSTANLKDTFSSKKQFNVDFTRMRGHRGANLTNDRAKC